MKKMKIYLFASDMDGTLLGRDFKISPQSADAVKKLEESGVEFAVATGRIYRDAVEICKKRGLNPYVISNNGACIFDKNGTQIYGRPLGTEELIRLTEYLEREEICYGFGESEHYVAAKDWEEVLDQEVRRLRLSGMDLSGEWVEFAKQETLQQNGLLYVDSMREHLKKEIPVYSVSMISFDREKMKQVERDLADHQVEIIESGVHNAEIMYPDSMKGDAVQYLCKRLGISLEQLAAAGDSLNDLDMLQRAGTGFVVDKSNPRLLEAGDYIISKDSEDRIVEVVDKILELNLGNM